MPSRSVMDAAAELQALIDDNKEKIGDDGFYLALSNAAMKVHERAAALDEDPGASDEEEQDEDEEMGDWEDGDCTARAIADELVETVRRDEDDFADLVSGLHVHALTRTRRPKACAMAMVELLKGLDRQSAQDATRMRKWKNQIIALDGHGRLGYILKQTWLDDDYENGEDSDPRAHVVEIIELLAENDGPFADLMHLRGNLRALGVLAEESAVARLREEARRVLAKLEEALEAQRRDGATARRRA